MFAPAATATTVVAVTAPAGATVPANATVSLAGASVGDSAGNGDQLLVTISAASGTVSLTETAGLALATGYDSFTDVDTVAFQGTVSDINTALESLAYTAPAQHTTDSVSITATSLADADGNTIAYLPSTGHFYEYVASGGLTWYAAQSDANALTFDGAEGYLATIPNAAVSSFLEQHLAANDVWAGGESFDYPNGYDGDSSLQRVWVWADGANQFPTDGSFTPDSSYYGGPLAGEIFTECTLVPGSCEFTNQSAWAGAADDAASWVESAWNSGEPNNSGYSSGSDPGPDNGEHYMELNTGGSVNWNDLAPDNDSGISGYVVEFGDAWGGASSFPDGQGSGATSIDVAQVPAMPTAVNVDAASAAGGQATVSWTAPVNDGGSPISGYEALSSAGQSCSTTGATSCTISGLTDGSSYSFSVAALNAAGSSAPAESPPATVLGAPLPPLHLTADGVSAGGGQVTLSWATPSGDGGSPVTGYTATASPGGASCTTSTSSCTVSGLSTGSPYTFVVTATNAIGTSAPSDALAVTPAAPASSASTTSTTPTSTTPTTTTPSSTTPTPTTTRTTTRSTTTPTATRGTSPDKASAPNATPRTGQAAASVQLSYGSGAGAGAANSNVGVKGSDFAPGSTLTVTMHSVPVRLGTVAVGSDGSFVRSFKLPADVPAGIHHVEVAGTGADGAQVVRSFYFQVSATGLLMRQSTVAATTQPDWSASAYVPALGRRLTSRVAGAGETPASITDAVQPVAGRVRTGTAAPRSRRDVPVTRKRPRSRQRHAAARRHGHEAAAGFTRRAASGEREIGGVRYPVYDPSSPAHAQQTGDTEVAVFTLLGMLALGGGLGAITGGFSGAALPLAGGGAGDDDASDEHHGGHSKSGNTLSNAKVKHLKFRHEAKAVGDRSATWVSPLVDRLDGVSLVIPVWLNRYSPLAARLSNDGAYARAIAGTRALSLPLLGLLAGIIAGLNVHGAAVPPAFGLLAVIVVIATLDASAGFLAALAYSAVVILHGGIYGAAAVRTLLAVDMIFFAGTLAASASRPLRRVPAQAAAEWYDRAADCVIGCLIGMWAISKMVGALSAIAGVALPIANQADALALVFGAAMLARYLLESAAAYWYPGRLAKVAPPKIGFPSSRQQIVSAAIKTAVYVFFAYAYIGWAWELYVGAALFFLPSVIGAYQMKLPNWSGVVRWLPAGVIKVVVMLIVGKACATLLYDHVSSKAVFVDLGFVLLGLPSLLLGLLGFFAREGETFALNWTYRLGGAGLVALAVLVVQGVVPIK